MDYSSNWNNGSSGITITGCVWKAFIIFSGTYSLGTTSRNMNSRNQRSVIIMQPCCPHDEPHEFSTFHFFALPLLSRSTAVSVMAWVEPLSNVAILSAFDMLKVVPKSEP